MKNKHKPLILLPFAVLAVCTLISPFGTSGVFYLDSNGNYHGGSTHFFLYLQMVIYLLACAYFVFFHKKTGNNIIKAAFLSFFAFALACMLVQSLNPSYLLSSMILTVGIMIICFVFEAPSKHVDALTGVFNKAALPPSIKTAYTQAKDFSLLLFSFRGFSYINHTMGTKNSDDILKYFAQHLERVFPDSLVFRTGGDEFTVLIYNCGYIDLDRLEAMCTPIPRSIAIGDSRFQYHFTSACINSSSCEGYREMLELHSYLSRQGRVDIGPDEYIGGEEFIAKYQRTRKMEQAIKRALNEQRVEVYFQPIHDPDNMLTSAEALMRIRDEELGILPAQECIEIAEGNGDILRLGEQVLTKVCQFVQSNRELLEGFDHISVNLSAIQCARDDLAETLINICDQYGTPNDLISYELTETAASSMIKTKQNMDELIGRGHCFFLDDFGTGYANFDHIAYLPFSFVKIDKSILWSAEKTPLSNAFLEKTIEMLNSLGIKSICEGVETSAQAELLGRLGVTLLQGYYFSKPLPPDDFIEYIRKARAAV